MLTREEVQSLRRDLQKCLDETFIGYKLTLGSCTYGGNIATFKLECAALNDDGETETKAQQDFRLNADRFGLRADALGKLFEYRGVTYKIAGMKPRCYKRPIIATDANDTPYKFSVDFVKNILPSTPIKKGKA